MTRYRDSRILRGTTTASFLIAIGLCCGMTTSDPGAKDPRNEKWDLNLDPHRVLGSDSCEKCHSSEMQSWKKTPHFDTFLTLHRKPEAQVIAAKLGIDSFKNDSNCIQCHYTVQSTKEHALEVIAGVSCESCHGAAKDWISIHNDYGGSGATKDQETPKHRNERLVASIQQGMRNPVNVYLVASSCYRCHTVPDERLVNQGGHKAGSMDFEFVSWSQGVIRHNFLRSDGKVNVENSPEKLRIMFVAGMIADLEFSLRATAAATEKATFGVTSAQRSARAAKRLDAAQAKLSLPILDEIRQVFASVQLKLNNSQPLIDAADQIHTLGIRFATSVSGDDLSAIDSYIPAKNRWK